MLGWLASIWKLEAEKPELGLSLVNSADDSHKTPPAQRHILWASEVRSAMFNSLGESICGARVLDAFAGLVLLD